MCSSIGESVAFYRRRPSRTAAWKPAPALLSCVGPKLLLLTLSHFKPRSQSIIQPCQLKNELPMLALQLNQTLTVPCS